MKSALWGKLWGVNRSHPKKKETFAFDFQNATDTVRDAFSDYYRTTILTGETDPNKLHNLKSDIERYWSTGGYRWILWWNGT